MNEQTKMTPAALKILETASQLFYLNGIHSTGVETIAKEAGVTKKTLYDRYGSKEQLVVAYLEKRDQQWRKHLHEYIDLIPEEQPLDRILTIFDAIESWLETNSPRGCAFINALAELNEPSHPGRAVIIEEKKWLKQLFSTLLKRLNVTNPQEIGEQLLVLHEGLMVTYSMGISSNGISAVKETVKLIIGSHKKS